MGILKNVGKLFVETEEKSDVYGDILGSQIQEVSKQVYEVREVNINTETVNLIEDIYKENNLSDRSKSIFKIEEIKKVLPDSLPNEAKKASVIGMMGVSGLSIENVIEDANIRNGVLNSALKKFSETTVEIISKSQDQINELESMINNLKEKMTMRKKEQENQEQIINDEIQKINNTANFIK